MPGNSDVDLLAVLDHDSAEGDELAALADLHAGFVSRYPEWSDRVEVGYVSTVILSTFEDAPAGRIAVISPGEPLNVKDVGPDWVLNWHGVSTGGETLAGAPPLELGPGRDARGVPPRGRRPSYRPGRRTSERRGSPTSRHTRGT